MSQLDKIRLADGRVLRPGDWTQTPLYSTVHIATGSISGVSAFSYGKGGGVPGSYSSTGHPRQSTLADTNMEGSGGVLAENEALLIYGLSIELLQTVSSRSNFFTSNELGITPDPPLVALTNVMRVQRDTLIRMKIAATKDYLAVPLAFLPAARGVQLTLGSARSEGSGYGEGFVAGSNGCVSEGTHRRLATPQEVNPGEAFEVAFEFPSGSVAGLDFGNDSNARIAARVFTRGLRMRPVA